MEKNEQADDTGSASPGVPRPAAPRAPLSREARILFGTLVVGFLGVIVTLSIGLYSENRADRRADVGGDRADLRSRLDEASRDRAQIREGIDAIRQAMQAGFEAAAQDRNAIRLEAAQDRNAIRLEAAQDRNAIRQTMQAGFEAAAQDRNAIRLEAAQDRNAIRRTMQAGFEAAAQDRDAIRTALREQGDRIDGTLLAALCLIDVVRHQAPAGASDGAATRSQSSFTSASCDRLESRADGMQ